MRDDDFDKRRLARSAALDPTVDRARVPGKQTLVEAELGASRDGNATPGKRTRTDIFSTWTQGLAETRDPITETAFQVSKARELMTKLSSQVPASQERVLRADLRCHVDAAMSSAAHAFARPNGREVAESALQLMTEAQAFLQPAAKTAADSDPTTVAARGVDGPGESLPHLETVQRLFGAHDLSGVRAHVGGAAADASRELGAHAYAYGDHIAFAEQPNVELVAHEATHIVQQRAGVSLKGIDGGASDAHEQHADAVASTVARGESAEPLLAHLSGGGHASTASVQRKGLGAPTTAAAPKPGGKERYLARNAAPLWKAVADYLQRVNFPIPDARLQWRNEALFTSAAVAALRANVDLEDRSQLLGVLYPAEPFGALDGIVPLDKTGAPLDMSWSPAVGHAIAPFFVDAIVASLQRLGPRWVEAAEHSPDVAGSLDENKSLVTFESLVKSAPIDIPVARALTSAAVVELVGKAKTKSEKPRPLREVKSYKWQGPKLWNWIRVTDPVDATPEEVAATLWGKDHKDNFGRTSFYAYGITAAPPLFGIPPTWAMQFDDASRFAPKSVHDGTQEQRLLEVASSAAGDELALAQAGHHAADKKHASVEQLRSTLGDSSAQLNFLIATLAPFKLDAPIANALRWVIVRQTELASATPDDAAKWEPAVVQQKAHLRTIVSGVQQVAASGNATAEPIRRVLSAYAHAAGVSFMAASCEQLIAGALAQQGALAVQTVRGAATDLQESVSQYEQSTGHSLDPKRFSNVDDVVEQCNRMQGDMLAGKQVDAGKLDSTLLEAQEITLHAKIDGLRAQLLQLRAQAAQVGEGAISTAIAAFHSSFRSVGDAADSLEAALAGVEQEWHDKIEFAGVAADNASYGEARQDARRAQLAAAQQRFAQIAGNGNSTIAAFFRDAATALKDQAKYVQIASTCIQILAMLGISFVASAAGGAVSRLVGSLLARGGGAELAEMSLGARLLAAGGKVAAFGSDVATEAAINVAGQHAMGQQDPDAGIGTELLENMIMSGGARLVLAQIAKEEQLAEQLEKQAAVGWKAKAFEVAGGAATTTASITGHVVLNVALGYVARQVTLTAGLRKESAQHVAANSAQLNDWFLQGVSIALGRFVHSRFAPRMELYGKLAKLPNLPRARLLATKADAALHLASTAEGHPSGDLALQLMGKPREILADEKAVLDELANSPGARQAAGMSVSDLAAARQHNRADAADVHVPGSESIPLINAHLEDLGGGRLWTGTQKQINAALDGARAGGLDVHETNANGVHKVTIADQTFEIRERVDVAAEHGADPHHGQKDALPPKPPQQPPASGGGSGSGPERPPHQTASAEETALVSGAVADREHSVASRNTARPGAHNAQTEHSPDEHVASDFLSDDQVDTRRWQYSALEEDPRGRVLLGDPKVRHWCDLWMSMPDGVTADVNGALHVKFPHGIPPEISAKLQVIVEKGNIGLMTRATALSERIAKAAPGANLDPASATWPATRQKLVEVVGEVAVEKYEREKGGLAAASESDRQTVVANLDTLLKRGELQTLASMVPGAEVYASGSVAQPSKKVAKDAPPDLDVFIVVADNVPEQARRQLESRLHGYKMRTPEGRIVDVDAKVMTRTQFAGLSMLETPGRTPLANARVDSGSTDVPGTGASGVDVHNHVMGVVGVDYFVNRIGGGSAVNLLDKAFALVHDPDLKPTVQAELGAAYADVKNARAAGMPPSALEARARRGLERVLAASEQVPFDHTYDLRDLLVQRFIDTSTETNPKGAFENFATDTIESLHDEGVTTSEQSVSISKLNKRFDESTMRKAHERAKAQGKDSELEFLAMVPTDKVLSADKGQTLSSQPTDASGKAVGPSFSEQLEKVLARGDVRGIDFAGPEKGAFTAQGKENFKEAVRLAAKASTARHEPIVVRPHVGEGYDPELKGEHVDLARKNLDTLLDALDELGYRGPDSGVIVRFGHATHATPAQLARMKAHGVIVEANVGSNLATGSILRVDEHPLLQNMYYGVSTMLSTDGQGVMSTTLPAEYQRAAEMIQRFRSGRASIEIDGRKISFSELKPEEQARFSIDWLTSQASGYSQVKQKEAGQH